MHFAADKKGRSGTNKRLKDAVKTLQELVLVSEDTEFDCHLQNHHVICLGDMNFRVQETPDWILQEVGKSVSWELRDHERRIRAGRDRGRDWRDIRLAALRLRKGKKAIIREYSNKLPTERDPLVIGREEKKEAGARRKDHDADDSSDDDDDNEEEDETTEEEEDKASVVAEWTSNGEEDDQPMTEVWTPVKIPTSKMMRSARAWSWLQECEELIVAMRETQVFYGFQEQTIRFPPSFKWKAHADAHSFTDVDR